ncbi:MAG: hypothetical protein QXY39_05970, partial [Thermofilaceae archaeon]
YVRVRKKKNDEQRLMVIPDELMLMKVDCTDLIEVDDKRLRDRVRQYIRSRYGVNTHSLRYAFITHLLRMNVNVSIISRITHHSNLNYVLRYTQQIVADDVLRSI